MLNDGPPVEPRPSAAVIVVQGRSPWRVLMMRRPGGAEFAPDAYVYPGGSVHAEDAGFADPSRATAARELFEEVGLLLARGPRGFARDRDCNQVRARMAQGQGFAEALGGCRLQLAPERLVYLTRWITPPQLRRRFDTRFYIARLPAGQTIEPQVGEVVDWLWVDPAEALRGGTVGMVHATRRILEFIAGQSDVSRLIARLRRRRTQDPPVRPELLLTETGWTVVEPLWRGSGLGRAQRQSSRQRS
jgi:8-oxo-dGTP pyrophosphatase MutT (NUDIX family)